MRIFFVASTDPVAVWDVPSMAHVVAPAAAHTALSALQDTTPCRRDAGEILEKGRGSEWVSAGWGRRRRSRRTGCTAARRRRARASEQQHPSPPLHHASLAQNIRDDDLVGSDESRAHRHIGADRARGLPNILRCNHHGCTTERSGGGAEACKCENGGGRLHGGEYKLYTKDAYE